MLDNIQYDICKTQGNLYEWAANEGLRFPEFSNAYMKSDFCHRSMDTEYSRFQLREPEEHIDFLVMEIPTLLQQKYNNEYFSGDVAFWIGFTYRQLWFETGMTSKEIVEKYPFDRMLACYPGLHTLDEDMAADILLGR